MEVQQDYKELLELLNSHKVEYIIVGAYALAHHGVPRYTGDIDIWVRPTADNAARVMVALTEFGVVPNDVDENVFCIPGKVVQLGFAPVRIDLLTAISGLTWEEGISGQDQGEFDGVPVYYIGREQLIKNKRASGRSQDIADVKAISRT